METREGLGDIFHNTGTGCSALPGSGVPGASCIAYIVQPDTAHRPGLGVAVLEAARPWELGLQRGQQQCTIILDRQLNGLLPLLLYYLDVLHIGTLF